MHMGWINALMLTPFFGRIETRPDSAHDTTVLCRRSARPFSATNDNFWTNLIELFPPLACCLGLTPLRTTCRRSIHETATATFDLRVSQFSVLFKFPAEKQSRNKGCCITQQNHFIPNNLLAVSSLESLQHYRRGCSLKLPIHSTNLFKSSKRN